MSAQVAEESMLSGNTTREFFRFVVPSIVGLLAVSSAGIVDGIFVGNYVGSTALAAVNLVTPLYSLFFGLCVMMLVGGAVVAGKALGSGDVRQARNIFTKSMIVIIVYGVLMASLGYLFAEHISLFMGANEDVLPLTVDYIRGVSPFLIFIAIGYALSYFARIDDAPNYALAGLMLIAATNMVLDYVFIKALGWGIEGAAFATGLSYVGGTVVLVARLFGKSARITPIKPFGSWLGLVRAAYNGLSEFINEMSGGLVMFIINWILMTELGTNGVAAFTIVNYIIWLSVMISYGGAEALGPLVSVNFGAGRDDRIARFLNLAVMCSVVTGVVVIAVLMINPEAIASAFVSSSETETLSLTLGIIAVIWPMFLFNGINISVSGYFTGMHAAAQSAAIAISRSLVLPLILILVFWKLFGVMGAFAALPVAEALTFGLTAALYWYGRPSTLVAKDQKKPEAVGTLADSY
ncbi:MATE family efflux transporter [Parendozoicomonas haliclonae]|uniref:Multidrug export protein MepA n=1 Tax=Parendozoicomonas haliclonae TaxID=1960125 RepID=A0A1X7AR02_9GAMM|nr:MATE family efflux transporter [Parendozoicomonas haliclonae]SMA50736.1 Multidrug export protein MepA [Parendozoicomonas haliclonae]